MSSRIEFALEGLASVRFKLTSYLKVFAIWGMLEPSHSQLPLPNYPVLSTSQVRRHKP